MNREPLTIVSERRVLTEASTWLFRPSTYLRLPRTEGPRPPIDDIDGATRDAVWHEHEGVCLVDVPSASASSTSSLLTNRKAHMASRAGRSGESSGGSDQYLPYGRSSTLRST